jgi:hypothetical protein
MSKVKAMRIATFAAIATLTACGVPQYDVYYNPDGEPSAYLIDQRIRCELADLVRKDDGTNYTYRFGGDFYKYKYGWDLVHNDYDIEITIYLEVNDTGGLTPTLKAIDPINTKLNTSFAFGATAEIQESRDHTYTETIAFPLSNISDEIDLKNDPNQSKDQCPKDGSNLSGVLGIKDIVDLAMSLPQTDPDISTSSPGGGSGQSGSSTPASGQSQNSFKQDFGGTFQFLVTKSVSATGPAWTLTHFSGPGGLIGLSRVNTDKLTIGFGVPMPAHKHGALAGAGQRKARPNPLLDQFMLNLNANYINSQLLQLQNILH